MRIRRRYPTGVWAGWQEGGQNRCSLKAGMNDARGAIILQSSLSSIGDGPVATTKLRNKPRQKLHRMSVLSGSRICPSACRCTEVVLRNGGVSVFLFVLTLDTLFRKKNSRYGSKFPPTARTLRQAYFSSSLHRVPFDKINQPLPMRR